MVHPGVRVAWLTAAGLVAGLVAGSAEAAGFYLQDQSVRGVGRAHAGDGAIADDASTIYFNPAGMTQLKQAEFDFGLNLIMPHTGVTDLGSTATTPGTGGGPLPFTGNDGGNPFSPAPVGHLYLAMPLKDDRTWLGLGLSAPFGLNVRYTPGWFGRYDSTKTVLKTIDMAPTVAYKIADYLSVGGGIDVQYATAKLENAIPNPLNAGGPTAATDGALRAKGDDWSVGFNAGVLITPMTGTRIGLHYRSAVTHHLHGDTMISGLTGLLSSFNGSTATTAEIDLPDIATFAVAHDVTPDLTLLAHVMWFGWTRFNEVRLKFANGSADSVIPENYENTLAFALGAEYAAAPHWRVRGGFQYDETPTINGFRDTRVPDGSRYWFSGGATYAVTDNLDADFSYAHVLFDDTNVALTRTFFDGTAVASAINLNGALSTTVDFVSFSLRYRF
ncbi:MAG: outer membrane protein transport protein [Alphaproteobacteria bacterium]